MGKKEPIVVTVESSECYRRLLSVEQTVGMKCGLVTLAPGCSVGEHTTDAREEVIIFLEGTRVRVVHGEQGSLMVSKGELVYMPPFTRHDVRNEGGEACRYLYVTAPLVSGVQPE
jgi:mannose-6-phosphate isomerase-like protein (cupin superfamily)